MRIAIPIPTTSDHPYNQRCWPTYAEAIRAEGAEPVQISLKLSESELKTLVESCSGILLPGSPADVDPARFGQQSEEHTSPADPERERTDLFLIEHAYKTQKPLLGVCFGCQILNVYHGGTLLQDLAILPVNHPSARGVAIAHTASIPTDSLLASICNPEEASFQSGYLQLPVNSSHHQAIGIAAPPLRIVARCPQDGVIEAIEDTSDPAHFVLAVQWHPERTTENSLTSRAIFARFVREAQSWQGVSR